MKKIQLACWAGSACVACASAEPMAEEPGFMDGTIRSSWAPISGDEPYAEKTLAEWGVEYMRWRFSATTCDLPLYDQDGSLCDLYQPADGPAFFLDFSTTDRVRTKCRIPSGKAIVVPIMTFTNDNASVDPPLSDEELFTKTSSVLESMRDLELRVDGKAIDHLSDRKIAPTRFTYTLPSAPNYYTCTGRDGVEDKTIDPAFLAGYVAVFPPPEPGIHELQYAGVLTIGKNEFAVNTRTRFLAER